MARVLSGLKPTGPVTLGNYLGALRFWVEDQHEADSLFMVADLHALTVPSDPARLRALTVECGLCLVAAGLDPELCTVFVQSHVAEHTELSWLLECTARMGELGRMTQFKDKSAKGGEESASVGLFTYPVLMAADILLYDVDRVPVGEDQRQHLELTRDVAQRFNARHGAVFVVPEAAVPRVGARVKDLQDPTRKMSASSESVAGTILVLDPPEVVERKIKRAVTDTGTEVRFDVEAKPGVSNLLTILGAATGRDPETVAGDYSQYGPLKADTADAVVELLRPLRKRYDELAADPAAASALLASGAAKAQPVAAATVARARDAMGLLPRG
ncbi:MAG TPA: tryptophan--tRNA ligase [Acidimicrobiales bacterium]|jgi:tryptophanyl-tRNA synthetase|nr:tryptophan--tRNA ligase [Acidimicrobiales bacterium]